jgi:4-hydroxythreonine-4-phosphate dehydrogenase
VKRLSERASRKPERIRVVTRSSEPAPALSPVLAVTAGEPAGIGPDLCVSPGLSALPATSVVFADERVLAERARLLGVDVRFTRVHGRPTRSAEPHEIFVWHLPADAAVVPGKIDSANGAHVLSTLAAAADACMSGVLDGIVTAPVSKAVINDAGFPFTGHTEFFAKRTGADHVVMMLVGGGMRVALATTHLALKDVPGAITRESLARTLEVLQNDLSKRFGIGRPRILVAGLNPHAGESGHLGREEIDVIAPVLDAARARGHDVVGPLPADTLFHPERLRQADAVLAMYHDQGLPVLKHASFGSGVNVTLGLPIIRTSVDHGTALDLAGSGRAEAGSLIAAVTMAAELAQHEHACSTGRANASVRTSSPTKPSSQPSSAPSRLRRVSGSSKSAPGSRR